MRDSPSHGVCKGVNNAAKGRTTEKGKVMKTTVLLATATAALLLTLGTAAAAAEPLHSPKGKVLADSLARVPGTTADMIDRSVQAGSPKHNEFVASLRRVSGTTEDMIVRNGPAVSPRLLSNEPWRLESFRVAPLK